MEAKAQREVVRYLRKKELLFCAPCNGAKTGPIEKYRLKLLGLEKGVPDLLIFTPSPMNPQYRGIAIEMKADRGGKVSPVQAEYIRRLKEIGWLAEVCYGAEDAIEMIEYFYELPYTMLAQSPSGRGKVDPVDSIASVGAVESQVQDDAGEHGDGGCLSEGVDGANSNGDLLHRSHAPDGWSVISNESVGSVVRGKKRSRVDHDGEPADDARGRSCLPGRGRKNARVRRSEEESLDAGLGIARV